MRPLYVEPTGTLWASRGMRVYRSQDHGRSFEFVARYRGDVFQHLSRASRLVERFTRSGFQGLVSLPDGSCVATVRGWILRRKKDSTQFEKVFRMTRGSRPMNICLLPNGTLAWGEYFFNQERDEVHIYASDDGGESWEVVYTFPRGRIRHVHGIVYDRFRDGVWVFTGDEDHECTIIFSGDEFRTMESVMEGGQRVRSACLVPLRDGLIVPTDTTSEQNFIQWFDPARCVLERSTPVSGSVFYGCTVGESIILSVSAEPSRVNTSRSPSLFMSRDGRAWSKLYSKPRDVWQLPYSRFIPSLLSERAFFQHPVFALPDCQSNTSHLYAYGQAVAGDDNCLLIWNLSEQSGTSEVAQC